MSLEVSNGRTAHTATYHPPRFLKHLQSGDKFVARIWLRNSNRDGSKFKRTLTLLAKPDEDSDDYFALMG